MFIFRWIVLLSLIRLYFLLFQFTSNFFLLFSTAKQLLKAQAAHKTPACQSLFTVVACEYRGVGHLFKVSLTAVCYRAHLESAENKEPCVSLYSWFITVHRILNLCAEIYKMSFLLQKVGMLCFVLRNWKPQIDVKHIDNQCNGYVIKDLLQFINKLCWRSGNTRTTLCSLLIPSHSFNFISSSGNLKSCYCVF